MEISITCLWQILSFSNPFRRFEMKNLLRRATMAADNISQLTYKTVTSEANVETNRMVSAKWTYHKEWSFVSNYLIFLKILFQSKNFL